jgi:hypothetical protein
MKKLLLLGISIPFMTLAQVGINTSNPYNSAALQVESSNKGILIPRVNITNTTSQSPISVTPKDGLLVYNSGTSQGTHKRYFWDSTANSGSGAWNKSLYFKETLPRLLI